MIDNKPYLLALNRIHGIGPCFIMRFLKLCPNLSDVFRMQEAELQRFGLSAKISRAIKMFDFNQVDDDISWEAKSSRHKIITFYDEFYPSILKQIYSPPQVLYLIGDDACLSKISIAIIGTRNPSVVGGENAYSFAFNLASLGVSIVSGLAIGIDGKAHSGAIDAKGATIAVMGTGVDNIYPRRHFELAQKICENGLLISEFPLKSLPKAGHFPRRNRIISGLSVATLVVEAAVRSGSLITAHYALEQNREVLAIPGSIHNQQSRGCNYLLQQGAKLVTSYQDVLQELNLEDSLGILQNSTVNDNRTLRKLATASTCAKTRMAEQLCTSAHEDASIESTKFVESAVEFSKSSNDFSSSSLKTSSKELGMSSNNSLKCEGDDLMQYIGFEVTSIEQMLNRSGMSINKIMSKLAWLELKGFVCMAPGGYMRCK